MTTSIQPPVDVEGLPPIAGDGFSVELPEILFALRRRWWLIAALVALCAVVFYIAASRQPKVYVASAKIVLEAQLPKVLDDDLDMNSGANSAETVFYNTQYEIMRSRAVLRGAIAQLKLVEDAAFLEAYGLGGVPLEQRAKLVEDILAARLEIVPEHQSRIFDSLYSTKGDKGTGLGLAVVRTVALHHGGTVHLEQDENSGARFVLRFPLHVA